MSFEKSAAAVVLADEAARARGEKLILSARERLFFAGLNAEGYGEGLDWLTRYAEHTRSCEKVHTTHLTPGSILARDLLKLVSYGYMRSLMERTFKLSLAYPEHDAVMFAPAGVPLEVPAFTGNIEAELERNPLATAHLIAMAQQAVTTNTTCIHAVAPQTPVAQQLLHLLAGESLRNAVIQWLGNHVGSPLSGNWYGCCAPAIAPRGKLSLTFEEQLKYQTSPTVMC